MDKAVSSLSSDHGGERPAVVYEGNRRELGGRLFWFLATEQVVGEKGRHKVKNIISVDSKHRTMLVTGLKFRVHLEECALGKKAKDCLIKNSGGKTWIGRGQIVNKCTHFIFRLRLLLASKLMLKTISSSPSLSSKQPYCAIQAGLELLHGLTPVFMTCILSPPSSSTSSSKKHTPRNLLILTELWPMSPNVYHSWLSEGQRWSTQQPKTIRGERQSVWNQQLLDNEKCKQCPPHAREGYRVLGKVQHKT